MARWSIAVVDAEAARGGLGGRRAIHAERRLVELPVLAGITALALLLALRAGLAHSSLITAGLVPVVMLAVLGYRFVPPTGGARTVAVYERGFIEASNAGLRTVRWDDVSDVESTVSRSAWTSWSSGLARRRELAVEIDREVQPRVLEKARALVGAAGAARFGPLIVTRDGLGQDGVNNALMWSQIMAHRRVDGDGLLVLHTPTSTQTEPGIWFDQAVPNAITADRLIDELDPAVKAGDVSRLLAADLEAEWQLARRQHAWGRGAVVALAAVSIVPALLWPTYAHESARATRAGGQSSTPPLPLNFFGYDAVCQGTPFGGASAYVGGGPHPIVFVGDDPNLAGKFADEPTSWATTDLARVQLVACVDITNGPVAATCAYGSYVGPQTVTETIYYADFTITVYQAKTARRVGRPIHMRGQDGTCPNPALLPTGQPSPTRVSYFTVGQIQQALGGLVE